MDPKALQSFLLKLRDVFTEEQWTEFGKAVADLQLKGTLCP